MTEQYKPNCCTGCTFVDECFSETRIKCADYEIAIKEYDRGFAEGRKEGYEQGRNNERELQCGKKNYEKDIARLEKEIAELKKENKELKQHNEELDTFDRSQSYKLLIRIDELKAVIQSMMNEESKYTLDELEKLLEDK